MNPLLDQLATGGIVAAALGFFALRFWRKRRGGKNCGSDCGCGTSKASPIPKPPGR